MATFRKQKSDLSVTDKKAWLESGYEECKASELMLSIIEQMFDFEIEESILGKEVFSIPEKMALVLTTWTHFFRSNQASLKKVLEKLQK